MLKIISSRLNFLSGRAGHDSIKRFFLSDAYKCEEAWARRLKNPIFQKVDPNSLYHELDVCFQNKKRVSVVDVDLLLTSVQDASFKNELDDVLLQVRLVPECGILPERSTHAAIRWYVDHASKEDLMNILSDRLNYGLFPDYYLNNLLMDKYLKEGDAVSAVKIAVLQMLQEDFDHPIMKVLALHCCYNYLESPEIWESYVAPEPDPDEEVQKVRVNLLRNPYFDDHFDIVNTNHLVGKTLWLFGRTVSGALGTSSQLVGLILYEKYDRCAELLERIIKEGMDLHLDAVTKAKEYCVKTPKQMETEKSEAGAAEGGQEQAQVEPKSQPLNEAKDKVLKLLEKLEKKKLNKENLLSVSAELVRTAVGENESKDIKHQCEVYQQWEKDRETSIQKETERAELQNVQSKIEQIKAELEREEERLFFFDREEELQMEAGRKEKEKESVVFYKGKGKHREQVLDDYVPPDVSQRK